jgi:hypothetical protein
MELDWICADNLLEEPIAFTIYVPLMTMGVIVAQAISAMFICQFDGTISVVTKAEA